MALYRLYLLDEHRHALMSKPQKNAPSTWSMLTTLSYGNLIVELRCSKRSSLEVPLFQHHLDQDNKLALVGNPKRSIA
jgi:hypothetical protein